MTTSQIDFRTVTKELPIFSTNISQHTEALRLAKEAIFEQRKQNPESIKSNVNANYVSGWASHLENPKYKPLTDIVLSFCEEISRKYFKAEVKFQVFNCWGMLYDKGDYTIKHSHYPSVFAAVVYLDMEGDSAPIEFEDQLTIVPSSGSLVVFPALLEHQVPKTDGKRIVIAMNIDYHSG